MTTAQRIPSGVVLAALAAGGACTMSIELAAVRVLAPWFGTSQAVWTNVIGVILVALSTGYLIGARLSSGPTPLRRLGIALLGAAFFTATVPFQAERVARWFLPHGLALDEAATLLHWGSLAAALVMFLPPALILGLCPPLGAEALQRARLASAGAIGGVVLAVSTLGSLVGTFATTYWAIPTFGLRATFAACAAVLAILGIGLCWIEQRRAIAIGGAIGMALTCVVESPAVSMPSGHRLLEARESRYQSVRVVETEELGAPTRKLQVNEGLDSFQSVWRPEPGLLPPGYYYNYFAPPAWLSPRAQRWRVLVLGLGAGTAWRVLDGALPPGCRLESDGVEIDGAIVQLGQRWMDLPGSRAELRAWGDWDGRAALVGLPGPYDQIVLDAYANQTEIPAHMASVEFFREVARRLAPGGWISINVGGFGLDDPVVRAVAETAAEALSARVLAISVPFSRNCMIYARRGAELPDPAEGAWTTGEARIDALLAPCAIPGTYGFFTPGGDAVLYDDRNDVERRQRTSLARGKTLP
ncbi:MAG: fused MFS/spermidine synthase [Planctomycetota bacterium]